MPRPAVYQLLGYPGTGKYTVACEIVRQLREAGEVVKLLDNHTIANLLFDLTPAADGKSRLPPGLSARVSEVKAAVLKTIEEQSPTDWSFVFTNFVPMGASLDGLGRLRQLAADRGAAFVLVLLTCDEDEVLRRVVHPDRQARMKLIDPDRAREILREGIALPDRNDFIAFDVTTASPAETAAAIIAAAGA